ncbi:MAG: hypothetical protein E8D51_02760 [Nitrospira sp.]|nr:MAG: hypothetical protein E8D51_02760 [Nitrospira sp.]
MKRREPAGFAFLALLLCSLWPVIMSLAESAEPAGLVRIEQSDVQGLKHTRSEALLDLLPRPLPAAYTEAEIREFERRVRNLSLFDRVTVAVRDQTLAVEVQEKFTLAPILNFTSGSSPQDLNATGGLVEYNIDGGATALGALFNYSQRGANVEVWLSQHAYSPTRWAKEIKGAYNNNGIRFAESSTTWDRRRMGGEFELKAPFWYGSPLRFEFVAKVYREEIQEAKGAHPPNGTYIGLIPEVTWDRYHWHDLVPKGYRLSLELRPGYFLGPNQNRHEGRIKYLQGIPLGDMTVLMINATAEAVNAGNANHSLLLGSQVGIRGLSDNLLRNHAQTYANVEFRHAFQLAPRWALQVVGFSDFGAYQTFTEDGKVKSWRGAVNAGGGARLIPTFLSNTLLRVDYARLMEPIPNTLVQVGITQYF